MRGVSPSTSEGIAGPAGLNERYVRKWLGAMVTGRVIDYEPDAKTYALPDEHAVFLTRDVAPDNLAVFAQFVPVLGPVEDATHNQARPRVVLWAIAETLKPGGTFLMQDIAGTSKLERDVDHPFGPMMYTISCLHYLTVSLAEDGENLCAIWGEEKAREPLGEAGFGSVEVSRLDHDPQNSYYVARTD